MTTTCRAMLAQMLEADLGDLTGGGGTLAAHVRECATCRAVAGRLARDTELLAQSIASAHSAPNVTAGRSRSTAAHRVPTAALIAVAASVAIIAIGPSPRASEDARVVSVVRHPIAGPANAGPKLADVAAAHSSGTLAPHRRSSTSAGPHGAMPARVSRPGRNLHAVRPVDVAAVTVAPTVVAAHDPAVPVTPVKLDVAPRESLGSGVAVDPPAGKRADIIRTDRPGITVVWLR